MKFFENKKIWKKIVIMLLIVLLFQFGFATPVRADGEGENSGYGGILLSPIMSLIVALGDRSGKHTSPLYNGANRDRD